MNVLFVCSGNTCRSPMAAALFNKIACERDLKVRIDSAGVGAIGGDSASFGAVEVMKNFGIDLYSHRSKPVNLELIEKSDLILTMTAAQKAVLERYAKGKVFSLCEYSGFEGEVKDPFGGDKEEYEACANQLYDLVLKVGDRLADN